MASRFAFPGNRVCVRAIRPFGTLIASDSRLNLPYSYLAGAGLMFVAAAEAFFGVKAEQQSLDKLAAPISEEESGAPKAGSAN